ncbi:hypothetical protein SLEP1_g46832 [Rubroshorea leprosula]|uniref:Disease resistance protein RGA3 n=1 Tax=Rubroshorea leprosula TaxID=152421 RepID=A0AAV5LNK0_9ROSI|nr:hypothetical protein SLEP1_g46832 [Rubroshorea leprosula]
MGSQICADLLSAIIDSAISNLISAATEQISLALGWEEELETLQNKLRMIKDVLLDADERQVRDRAVKGWLEKLRDVVFEADDVLDEVAYESEKCKVENQNQKRRKLLNFLTSNPLRSRSDEIARKIKKIIASVEAINNEATQFGLQNRLAGTVVSEHRRNTQTHSTIGDLSEVVGREDDISKIVHLLTDSLDESQLSVLSIVGMPGLGKTTLAQALYNDEQIRNYFGERIWVCVSDNFEVEKILTEMLESLTGNSCAVKNKDTVIQKIREAMGENNFLLVLDDMWDEESHGKFEDLRSCLLGVCKMSRNRVIVTTRNEKVALKMRTLPKHMHHLGKLQTADCWSIIRKRVPGDASITLELEKIGRDIAQLCGGVPLVARVIGGILCTERLDRVTWLLIKGKIEALGPLEHDIEIRGVIKLSFDQLPELALKQCFAFCSIFPKDFVMERELLIQLWMALGFLQSTEESLMTMEDIGNKYVNDLLSYSLFEEQQRDSFGTLISCKMHDLIHDFAQLISKSETMIWKSQSNIPNVRNLNLIYGIGTVPTNLRDVAPKLRTLFLKGDFSNEMKVDLRSLRVLSFVDSVDTKELPPCVGNMKNLRYLDISRTQITKLPEFIPKLCKLQTFRFITCRSLEMPPEGIGSLINLRHIYFSDEEQMPTNIGKLTCLQTLPMFFVGTTMGCKIEELGSLRGLRGSLKICNLEHVKDKSEAMGAKLHEKTISKLRLRWGKESNQDEDVLEGLQPHSDLQVLEIDGYGGKNLPSWMLKNVSNCDLFLLKNLAELRLEQCKKLESIPVMTGFSSLQMLSISNCAELSTIAEGAFVKLASLKELHIFNCCKLERVSANGSSLPHSLLIPDCRELNSLSTSTCLKVLTLCGCKNLRYIPSLYGLSSLEDVTFSHCGLEHLPNGLSSCIALKKLTICSCDSLISIPEELKEIHSLVDLWIDRCSKLRSIPENTLNSLTNLKRLRFGGFSEELEEFSALGSFHSLQGSLEELDLIGWGKLTEFPPEIQNLNLTSLQRLSIEHFEEVETLPKWLGSLSSLKSLTIWGCLRLKYLPSGLSFFTTLERLTIYRCPNLVSANLEEILGGLTRLKALWIGPFPEELEEFPISLSSIHNLGTSLEELCLCGWEKLTQLPHQIRYLTALRHLSIYFFDGVKALPEWLGSLSSLQSLGILHCKNLKHLPSAEAIRCLSKLTLLHISDCPELGIRCDKGRGPEWHKISHIPTIYMNGKQI